MKNIIKLLMFAMIIIIAGSCDIGQSKAYVLNADEVLYERGVNDANILEVLIAKDKSGYYYIMEKDCNDKLVPKYRLEYSAKGYYPIHAAWIIIGAICITMVTMGLAIVIFDN